MKFGADKKSSIKQYILEKILQGEKSISHFVADTFDISPTTVHSYLNELLDDKIINKVGRGLYELNSTHIEYKLARSNGDLNSDTHAFEVCLKEHIKDFPSNIKEIWEYGFTEMVNNVMDHSMAEHMHILISQNHLNTSVFIMDDGIGIFKKIMDHFSLSSVDEAICELFKGKLTTDEVNHSGEGIFFTSKMMDLFIIYSSEKIFTTSKYYNEDILDAKNVLSGTCVYMSLSNFSHKTVQEVFNSFANIDGGFTKTRIPLKNIFDSSPVSRSQAKRICNRLEAFQEVTIDFNEINWMGQGFAHQLFIVFQNAHPEIKIIPINMNDEVTNMYNHVTHTVG